MSMKQTLKYLALALLVVLSSCRDEFAEIQTLQTDEVRGTEQLNEGDNTALVMLATVRGRLIAEFRLRE